jgi:hypothetical protein
VTPFSSFMPSVLPYVYGCPDVAAEQALRLACIDFCKRTDIVQAVLAPVDVVLNGQDYPLTMPDTNMQLARVLGVSWQGKWLTPVDTDNVQSDVALRGAAIGSATPVYGDPGYYFQKTPDTSTVSLYPIPNTALTGGLLFRISTYPTIASTQVHDQLYNEWVEVIAAGALARLLATPGQPFTGNPEQQGHMFERGISRAKIQVAESKVQGALRVRPVRFI